MTRTIRSIYSRRLQIFAVALCVASAGLLVTPKTASAFDGDRSCACNNLELCPGMFQRFCCTWSGGAPTCECEYFVINCVEEE
jgi:hypothetical protein